MHQLVTEKKRKNLKTIEFKAKINNKEGDTKHPKPPVDETLSGCSLFGVCSVRV